MSGYTWMITYNDKSGAGGDVYTDTVQVGATTVTGQAVELASRVSRQFQRNSDTDGLLGLSFSSINRGMSCSFHSSMRFAEIHSLPSEAKHIF